MTSRRVVTTASPDVLAAGGVVLRYAQPGYEVAIVHRPKYDDWSLPKGKRRPHESPEDCAEREVLEETGYRGKLGPAITPVRYASPRGRVKEVHYFVVWAMSGAFAASDEVDALAWVPLHEAGARLSYDVDRDVLVEALGRVGITP